jgi:hypothetical protein
MGAGTGIGRFLASNLVSELEPNSRFSKPVSFLLFLLYSLSFLYTALKLIGQIPVF